MHLDATAYWGLLMRNVRVLSPWSKAMVELEYADQLFVTMPSIHFRK